MERQAGAKTEARPYVVGVMGGAFNPIHLGHMLLAVTALETLPVDEVVIVPVFKHPVKADLLPFEDRVEMCRLAALGTGVKVSAVEAEIGESNAAMLRALKREYPAGTELVWICGDDVFDWIDNAKGQAMLQEIRGMVVQRRLCRAGDNPEAFDSSPADLGRVEELRSRGIEVDIIYGKLPHLSSTLVRSSPALWRAYLPQLVAFYLDSRPQLLATLVGDVPARQASGLTDTSNEERSDSSANENIGDDDEEVLCGGEVDSSSKGPGTQAPRLLGRLLQILPRSDFTKARARPTAASISRQVSWGC